MSKFSHTNAFVGSEAHLLADIEHERATLQNVRSCELLIRVATLKTMEERFRRLAIQELLYDEATAARLQCRMQLHNYVNDLADMLLTFFPHGQSLCPLEDMPVTLQSAIRARLEGGSNGKVSSSPSR